MRPGGKNSGENSGNEELNEYSSEDDQRIMGLRRRGGGSGTESGSGDEKQIEPDSDEGLMGPKIPENLNNHESSGEMDDIELPPSIESNQSRSSEEEEVEEEDDIGKSLADAMAQQTLDRLVNN